MPPKPEFALSLLTSRCEQDKAGFRKSYCNQSMEKPWTLPRKAWTMNVDAVEGSEEDSYRFNPWRAPGSAPVVDPCGQAGGKFKETPVRPRYHNASCST